MGGVFKQGGNGENRAFCGTMAGGGWVLRLFFLFSGCLKSLPSGFWDGRMFVVSVAVKTLWQRWFQAALWFKEAEYV